MPEMKDFYQFENCSWYVVNKRKELYYMSIKSHTLKSAGFFEAGDTCNTAMEREFFQLSELILVKKTC